MNIFQTVLPGIASNLLCGPLESVRIYAVWKQKCMGTCLRVSLDLCSCSYTHACTRARMSVKYPQLPSPIISDCHPSSPSTLEGSFPKALWSLSKLGSSKVHQAQGAPILPDDSSLLALSWLDKGAQECWQQDEYSGGAVGRVC